MNVAIRRFQEFRVALMLLTRLPVGRVPKPIPTIGDAQWAYPWVGLFVGAICWGVFSAFLAIGANTFISATFSFAALVFVTGGLHQDGLADFADGIGGGRDATHCLEIMRDSRIGSFGVLALILAVLVWIGAVGEIGADASIGMFLTVAVVSRATMIVLLIALRPGRSDGLGAQASSGGMSGIWSLLLAAGLAVSILGSQGVLVVLAAVVCTATVGYVAWKRIKGHTGDVLGASQFLSDTFCWLSISVSL